MREAMEKLKILFFTGAGISAESGIPTFQEQPGIRAKLTRSFADSNPEEYRQTIRGMMEVCQQAQPNAAHCAIAELGCPVITMNVDKLHIKAGSKQVLEVHGEFPTKAQLEAPDFASAYRGIVLYDDVAPRYTDAVKLVKSLEYDNSHFVIVGTSFYTGISQKLLKLAKQRKAHVIVIDENAVERVPVICNNLKHIYGLIRKE